jgi:hypothetical protein
MHLSHVRLNYLSLIRRNIDPQLYLQSIGGWTTGNGQSPQKKTLDLHMKSDGINSQDRVKHQGVVQDPLASMHIV